MIIPRKKDGRSKAERLMAAAMAIPEKHASVTNANDIIERAIELGAKVERARHADVGEKEERPRKLPTK